MLNLQLAHKYSRAIFLLAQEDGKVDEYGEAMQRLVADIDAVPDLKDFLGSPMIPNVAKKETVEKCFSGDYAPMIVNFLCYLIDKKRGPLLEEIAREYEMYANEAQGIVVADVTMARELSDSAVARLTDKLAEVTGKKIKVRRHLDPAILGGVVVRMGETRVDGSLLGRVKALEEELLAH